jgi:hypothetical protein
MVRPRVVPVRGRRRRGVSAAINGSGADGRRGDDDCKREGYGVSLWSEGEGRRGVGPLVTVEEKVEDGVEVAGCDAEVNGRERSSPRQIKTPLPWSLRRSLSPPCRTPFVVGPSLGKRGREMDGGAFLGIRIDWVGLMWNCRFPGERCQQRSFS